jgi:CMP-N,N'-diacetyllegionaminic acid synthase
MNILGLITARGGSKGIPHKNIAPLAGRPLLAYTCAAARASMQLSRVVLSTDDADIAAVGRAHGAQVPFMRPAALATDSASSIDVARHALDWLAQHEGWQADILVILQPTSPLRTARHIDEALAALIESGADTVVSVVPLPHHCSPFKLMQLDDGRLHSFWDQPLPFDPLNRHSVPVLYARNGPAVLAARAALIHDRATFYGDYIIPYVMDEADSVDIDTPFDLKLAEWLLRQREAEAGDEPC